MWCLRLGERTSVLLHYPPQHPLSVANAQTGARAQVKPAVQLAAEAAGKALVELLSPLAVKLVLPTLLDNTETKKHWQARALRRAPACPGSVCAGAVDLLARLR